MGIDFGTESCRVALFDLEGRPVTFAATPYKTTHPRPGRAEQSPKDWWDCLIASTHKVMASSGVAAHEIVGIGYDCTTATVVPMDEKGEELADAIMWMDVRATEQVKRLEDARANGFDSKGLLYNGGGTVGASAEWYPFKAAWIKDNTPEVYAKAYRIVDATDWLTYKLTGEWTVSINTAAFRMYYNRDFGGWPVDLYETIGIGDIFDKIPERILDVGTPVAGLSTVAAQLLGLLPGTPVAQGMADAFAGQVGLGVVTPGKMALITGSSHVLAGQSDKPAYGPGFWGSYTDGVMPGQYSVEGGQVSTGSVMKWYKDNFASDMVATADKTGLSVYDLLNRAAAEVPVGSDGLIVNEYFQGNRTPYTDAKARGIIWGLSLAHGSAHIYRAIQEGICYGTAHILREMGKAGFEVKELVACGGMTKSRDLMQLHADITGVPITITEVGDAVALGSSMLGAVGAGVYSDVTEAASKMVHTLDQLTPDQGKHDEYQYYFEKYTESYPAMRELIHDVVDHEAAK
jgi:FGGY-family pentulose kinase